MSRPTRSPIDGRLLASSAYLASAVGLLVSCGASGSRDRTADASIEDAAVRDGEVVAGDVALPEAAVADASAEAAAPVADASAEAAAPDAGALFSQVKEIIALRCSSGRCHGNVIAGAGLVFQRSDNFRDQLVNVPACEYDRMLRIEPGHPERSWLMVKLTADVYETPELSGWIQFDPDPDWSQPDSFCAFDAEDGTPLFGLRMPATAPNKLSDAEIEVFRLWIQAGAPAP